MELIDTHAHLNDERFDADRASVIDSLSASGVTRVIDVACNMDDLPRTLELIERYDFIYGAFGMHPHNALDTFDAHMSEVARVMRHKKMLAVGEIGLDYFYDFAPRVTQQHWFATQLDVASECKKPVILHIRDAFGDAMRILRDHRRDLRGVMHCYSGSLESAYECIDMGLYIAFGGALTFKNASRLAEVAKSIPLDRILIETDCPYLTPVPHRGERNNPSYVWFVAQKIAELRGITAEDVASATSRNARSVFWETRE